MERASRAGEGTEFAMVRFVSVGTAITSLLLTGYSGPTWPALVIVFFALVALLLPTGRRRWPR
jgi:hypothetical protein